MFGKSQQTKPSGIQFEVPDEYQDDSLQLYYTLMDCEFVAETSFLAKILAEYGATLSRNCVYCMNPIAGTDCDVDFETIVYGAMDIELDGITNAVTGCMDAEEKVRFWVDSSEQQDETPRQFLCVSCAAACKCVVCGLPEFDVVNQIGFDHCDDCGARLCIKCRQSRIHDSPKQYVYCDSCVQQKFKRLLSKIDVLQSTTMDMFCQLDEIR